METGGLIYFDHAATTFPKPREVVEEVVRCMTQYGGNAGRGAHPLSIAAAEKIFEARCLAAELFGCDPERIFFTMNTTQGLNMVLKGLLSEGDHVICSDLEHNAVRRPLCKFVAEKKISIDRFQSFTGDERKNPVRICASIARLLTPQTKMVVSMHGSNICSAKLPIAEIGGFCRRHGLLFVVDGAQSAGHDRISVDEMNIDALCVPSHKGLYGPQGCGIVALGKGITLETLMEGGNGVNSLEETMSESGPERYEVGTLPLPSIAGLCEGIRAVNRVGIDAISTHEMGLYRRARELLGNMEGMKLYASEYEGATLLFGMEEMNADLLGRRLAEQGICVRSGYHCAPWAHETVGTPEGGAVRVSFGMYNTTREIEALWRACREIQKGQRLYGK